MHQTALRWGNDVVELVFETDPDAPVRHVWTTTPGQELPAPLPAPAQPLVEVVAVGHGRYSHNVRHTASAIGDRLRLHSAAPRREGRWNVLVIEQHDPLTGLAVRSTLRAADGVAAVQSFTTVQNDGASPVMLQAVSSFASGAFGEGTVPLGDIDSITGHSEWLGENRFQRTPVRGQHGLVELDLARHQHQDARNALTVSNHGPWSSGQRNPVGALENRRTGTAWAWQVEHNGAWHVEISERLGGQVGELALGLFGPTDVQHQWLLPLEPGESFTSVPVSIAFTTGGWQQAVAGLTAQRRQLRLEQGAVHTLPVIFNDYMNTLMGDPTTEKLLPLIEAAARVGSEYFCIDAGWYDDGNDWFDSVGEWQPSTGRFPGGGLARVIDAIREAGMVPGLWLEPEVIGVRSSLAQQLPAEAFLQRHGVPVVEQGRVHLDLRHPAARAHLDEVVDRLVADFGLGYFKLDYNTTPGVGTDHDAASPGAGLLDHNRAYLDWLDGVLERHPDLLLENCASGAQRADYAVLSRLHVQSTSDQQNLLLYPPVAAAAPMAVLPEQAGNWAYPQPEMTDEEIAFTLVTGMLGRLYLAGHLNRMSARQLELVTDAVGAHRAIAADLARSTPEWPLGLPGWQDPWLALALRDESTRYLSLWHRDEKASEIEVPFPDLAGSAVDIVPVFPLPDHNLDGWSFSWSPEDGVLRVAVGLETPSARTISLRPRP